MLYENFWNSIRIYLPKGIDEIFCLKFSLSEKATQIRAIFL